MESDWTPCWSHEGMLSLSVFRMMVQPQAEESSFVLASSSWSRVIIGVGPLASSHGETRPDFERAPTMADSEPKTGLPRYQIYT